MDLRERERMNIHDGLRKEREGRNYVIIHSKFKNYF